MAGAGGRPGAAAPRCFSGSSPYLRRVPTVTLGTLKDEHGGRISAFLPRPRRRRQDGGCRPSQERAVAVLSPRFPQIIGKTLGFPQNAAGRVCARRVFCSAPRTDTFSPAFRLPPPWRMGIFGRAPSHPRQRGQPRGRGDGSSLAVAANIHGFSCQSPISLQGCSARIDESPRCPRSCRRQQDPGAFCSVSPAPILKPEPVPQTLQLVAGVLGSIISHYLGTHPHETP